MCARMHTHGIVKDLIMENGMACAMWHIINLNQLFNDSLFE